MKNPNTQDNETCEGNSKQLAKERYLVCKENELLSCSRERNKNIQKSLL